MQPRLRSRKLIQDIEIGELAELAHRFHETLTARKAAIAPGGFDWYPYDSFGIISMLGDVFTGRQRWLGTLIGDEPVVDVGCGDGAVSFFLEWLGARVYAVDHPPTNYNRMQGAKALKSALGSSVRIAAADLDARFDLPVRKAGLALFLGVLYHLKNPFGVLECIAGRARYCLLTTAITQYATDQRTRLGDLPVAFLAGRGGLRGDETNYWIFTEPGLRNLVDRAGWDVCDWKVVDDAASTLWGTQRDQRAICLLRSRVRPTAERSQLLAGWHKMENDAWRWTERRFSISLAAPARVALRCTVPAAITWPVMLSAAGVTKTLPMAGDYDFAVTADRGVLEFELNRALEPDSLDGRERGIVVRGVELFGLDSPTKGP
ncbi:MAG TPA: methyltransferase domain-containing protein [Candidatus Acidoferrales bacterium]|jgi:tRNA (mo5U34)-methyltransferase|nr:methyltransferase domain-containing protein [Candidatus Acidoferrales bacterium]